MKNYKRTIRFNWNEHIRISYFKQQYIEGYGWHTVYSKTYSLQKKKFGK